MQKQCAENLRIIRLQNYQYQIIFHKLNILDARSLIIATVKVFTKFLIIGKLVIL